MTEPNIPFETSCPITKMFIPSLAFLCVTDAPSLLCVDKTMAYSHPTYNLLLAKTSLGILNGMLQSLSMHHLQNTVSPVRYANTKVKVP